MYKEITLIIGIALSILFVTYYYLLLTHRRRDYLLITHILMLFSGIGSIYAYLVNPAVDRIELVYVGLLLIIVGSQLRNIFVLLERARASLGEDDGVTKAIHKKLLKTKKVA